MNLQLQISKLNPNQSISISGSKSETNRLLLLQALYPNLTLSNASDSDDSKVMTLAFSATSNTIDIHHAGTAMRFLTAYFAFAEGSEVLLTGSPRMQARPIKILVDALRQIGADISYEKNEGFPPLRIKGKQAVASQITIDANVSSQYISALLLIAPKLEHGLGLNLSRKITSIPYINMTLSLLRQIGVETTFTENKITVAPKSAIESNTIIIESDWSSASYFYSIVALSEIGTQISLSSFKNDSFQGDAALAVIYENFGVETVFEDNQIILCKKNNVSCAINLDLNHTPDLAQTIAVTAFALGMDCELTGLHTLKIKETDRLEALQNELTKLGARITTTENSFNLKTTHSINSNITIKTYNDHRMAMAFAPLALRVPVIIENAEVVSKSYPAFWDDLKNIGFGISQV